MKTLDCSSADIGSSPKTDLVVLFANQELEKLVDDSGFVTSMICFIRSQNQQLQPLFTHVLVLEIQLLVVPSRRIDTLEV